MWETFWERASRTKMGSYLTGIEVDFIVGRIDLAVCDYVADIGCEAGRFSLLVAKGGVNVLAIDIDLAGLKRLKEKGNERVHLILADARRMPFRDGTLSAVLAIQVLDYIPQLREVVGECRRVLKRGGSVILSSGNRTSLKSKLKGLRGSRYMHSYRDVMRGLRDGGFSVRDREGYNWLPFNRISESGLLPAFARIEGALGLRRLPNISPWILVHAVKGGRGPGRDRTEDLALPAPDYAPRQRTGS